MISTIHLEYTADMKHMKVTGIDNETVFKHTFYDPVNKVKTNIVFDGTVALCEKVSDYESDMTKCENTSTTCVKKFTQESILTHSDISTFIAWVREYNIQSEFLCDQGLVSGLRFTYKYAESGESSTQRFVTDAEKANWNAKWDYNENIIKAVKVDNAVNADTVNGKTVAENVPVGAKFTDTVYTHPASHPASMITESSTQRFVTDAEKLAWNSKSDTDTVTTINGKTGAITKADIVALGVPAQDTVYTHPTTHSISEVDGLQTALDGKVDDSQVLTNVPLNAKFTDTITTINGKTGAISKTDIVALGIPAQDTVYSHPNSHPASIITESASKRFVSDAEKSTWNTKWDYDEDAIKSVKVNNATNADTVGGKTVAADVPADAVFTDTVYSHPATHSADMITDGTTNKVYTSAEKTKLSGIATNANNYSHPTTHPASIIVQDTNNRFVTDAEKSAWNGKQNALGYTPLNSTLKGAVNGIAELDANGRVPSSQLPSYVDDVLEYTSKSNFPVTGESGKIYISSDTNLTYRWSGTAYVEISASLALGETSSTAFFGDKGKAAYNHSQTAHAPSNATANDTDANLRDRSTHTGTQSADTITDGTNNKVFTSAEKTKLSGIDTNANNYSHPTSDGNKHVPANGTTNNGKVLKAGATAGTYIWSNDNDTITTINGKTGVITKADIVALGIPAQDTVVDISGKADITYVDGKVLTDVPSGAKFTDTITTINGKTGDITKADITALGIPAQDTVYSHPSSHPASMITESSTKRFVSDSEKSTWNSKSDTDTITTINGKTGAIAKEDIVALGIPGESGPIVDLGTFNDQTELITDVVMNQLPGGHYTCIIGSVSCFILLERLSNMYYGTLQDSVSTFNYFEVSIYGEIQELKTIDLRDFEDIIPLITDMFGVIDSLQTNFSGLLPASGGVLENYTERLYVMNTSGGIIDLSVGNVFAHTPSGNTTYSITNPVSGVAHSFTLIINMGETARTLTFPASVKWQGGEIPDLTTANKTYVLTFMSVDGGTTWLGMFGGEF